MDKLKFIKKSIFVMVGTSILFLSYQNCSQKNFLDVNSELSEDDSEDTLQEGLDSPESTMSDGRSVVTDTNNSKVHAYWLRRKLSKTERSSIIEEQCKILKGTTQSGSSADAKCTGSSTELSAKNIWEGLVRDSINTKNDTNKSTQIDYRYFFNQFKDNGKVIKFKGLNYWAPSVVVNSDSSGKVESVALLARRDNNTQDAFRNCDSKYLNESYSSDRKGELTNLSESQKTSYSQADLDYYSKVKFTPFLCPNVIGYGADKCYLEGDLLDKIIDDKPSAKSLEEYVGELHQKFSTINNNGSFKIKKCSEYKKDFAQKFGLIPQGSDKDNKSDDLSVLTIKADKKTIKEGESVVFTFIRSGDLNEMLSIYVRPILVKGAEIRDFDITRSNYDYIDFRNGEVIKTFEWKIVNDGKIEPIEEFYINVDFHWLKSIPPLNIDSSACVIINETINNNSTTCKIEDSGDSSQ